MIEKIKIRHLIIDSLAMRLIRTLARAYSRIIPFLFCTDPALLYLGSPINTEFF